ncbi:zinc-dependent alcohol dehydrogenase [Parahaliea mediterranea]|uniref:Zinc-binding dehydrogenase n=1 Tax=Parahaliea mediterranea TaxID=651086 RepID=A0A939DF47_9GAMM|nr:zinc-binding dehydrogenase [Parahaliea mediterranea]MBN7796914.1 zinc-binding dehydrogenase [Parahaliea mediterranea]
MLPKTSFAMVQTGVRTLEARDVPIPDIDDESAILKIEACGICGSDYEQYEGQLPVPYPAIPGHEPLGTIAAIGDKAARRWKVDVGDRVAVEAQIACHHCHTCYSGQYQQCSDIRVYSFLPLTYRPGLWGAYSQYMYIDANSIVHPVDPALPAEIAVMFNPLGAGFRWAVELPRTQLGESVLIMGPGQRGLASVIAAREAGAGDIIVTGLAADAEKLRLAKLFGASHTIDVENEDAKSRVKELTQGRGVDVVIDLTPYATRPVTDAIRFARRGGRIVLAGMKGAKEIPGFVSDEVIGKELTIQGASGVTSSGYRSAIRAIEARRYPLQEMHTHNFPLKDAELAIKTLAREIPGDESIHSCLIPEF